MKLTQLEVNNNGDTNPNTGDINHNKGEINDKNGDFNHNNSDFNHNKGDINYNNNNGPQLEEKIYIPIEIVQEKRGWRRYGGVIFGAIASLFFSLTILTVKLLGHYHPFSISVWRFMGILIPSLPAAIYFHFKNKKANIFGSVWPLNEREKIVNFCGVQARGFITVGMVLFRFYALKYLSVADLAVISYSGPVFVMVLAYFFLDEKCGVLPILVAIVTCMGVIIIVRPPILTGESLEASTLIGVGYGLGSTICNSLVVILVRRTRKVHFSLTLAIGGIWGVAECLAIALAFDALQFPQGLRDSLLAYLALPAFAFLAQYAIIIALKFDSAGPVSLVRAFDVIFAFIWQIFFLGVYPDEFSLTGAGVIVFGVVVLTLRKWLSTKSVEYQNKSSMRLLLR